MAEAQSQRSRTLRLLLYACAAVGGTAVALAATAEDAHASDLNPLTTITTTVTGALNDTTQTLLPDSEPAPAPAPAPVKAHPKPKVKPRPAARALGHVKQLARDADDGTGLVPGVNQVVDRGLDILDPVPDAIDEVIPLPEPDRITWPGLLPNVDIWPIDPAATLPTATTCPASAVVALLPAGQPAPLPVDDLHPPGDSPGGGHATPVPTQRTAMTDGTPTGPPHRYRDWSHGPACDGSARTGSPGPTDTAPSDLWVPHHAAAGPPEGRDTAFTGRTQSPTPPSG